MLTGDITPTGGTAVLSGFDIGYVAMESIICCNSIYYHAMLIKYMALSPFPTT